MNGKFQVRLRALEMSDLDFLYEFENDNGLSDCTTHLMPLSRGAMKHFILKSLENDVFSLRQWRLVIEVCSSEHTFDKSMSVGFVDLIDFEPAHRRAEVGIAILAPFRQKGIATQALQQFCYWASQQLSLLQLYAYVQTTNIASMHLFESVGFRLSATLESWFIKGGKAQNAHLYQCVFP